MLLTQLMVATPLRALDRGPGMLCVDDFEDDLPGHLPRGWETHSDDGAAAPYTVEADGSGKFLAARDRGQSVILARRFRVDLERYPYLTFRWRVHEIPRDADERTGRKGDSAASVYITYRTVLGFIPVAVKYVWSSTLPVGTALRRKGTGRPWIVVAGSGRHGIGEWQTLVFDVRAAYRETFGGEPPRQAIGVGLLSDANATGSTAHADYDDVCFLSKADAGSGIQHIVEAE